MTADIETDAAQETKQADDVQKPTTRPNLRLVETEDDDQFDLFADSPSENFWTEDDQTGADAAAVPEAQPDPAPFPIRARVNCCTRHSVARCPPRRSKPY